MAADFATDFDEWLVETFARTGPFTMLIVLVEIGETSATPLRRTSRARSRVSPRAPARKKIRTSPAAITATPSI